MMKRVAFLSFILCLILADAANSQPNTVDIGIFSGATPDTLIIKARPASNISSQPMTNAQFTVKWSETSAITQLQWLFTSVGLFPQGGVFLSEGYRYQVFASAGGTFLNWTAGQEYIILKVKTNSANGDCTLFEIAQDEWTLANNGDYYFEVIGEDYTGIRYVPYVNFGTGGGFVNGDTTIYLGNSTGLLTLEDYEGNILHWERRINEGMWVILPGTAGQQTYEETPTLQGTWSYRVLVEEPGCPAKYAVPANITVELLAVWTGLVNSDWHNPGNWNVVGVPDSLTDGLVPEITTGNYPVINDFAGSKNLLIDTLAEATISQTGALTLFGFLKNDGTFTILADTSSAGSLIDQGIQGRGNFISGFQLRPDQWHLVASPVVNAVSAPLVPMNLHAWDEPTGQWVPVQSPADTLEVFHGYQAMATDPGQIQVFLEGPAYFTGTIQAELTNNGSGNGHLGGFNLLGNPYPSAIDLDAAGGWSWSNTDPAIYIYNGQAGNYGTWLPDDPGSSTHNISNRIGINQGFFVHVNHAHGSGTVSVNNNARVHDGQPIFLADQSRRSTTPYLKLRMSMDPASYRDELVVRFRPGAGQGFDNQADAYHISGHESAPQIYTLTPDSLKLAVNTCPELTENISIPMGFHPGQQGLFQLEVAEMESFGPDTLVVLEDLFLNEQHELQPGMVLNFLATPEDDPDRFMLHFQTDPIGIASPGPVWSFHAYMSGHRLHVINHDPAPNAYLRVFDIRGRLILEAECTGSHEIFHLSETAGIYILQFTGKTKTSSIKLMVY